MRNLFKAMFSLSVAVPALAVKQVSDFVRSGGDSDSLSKDIESINTAIEDRLDGTAKTVFEASDRLQRKVVDSVFVPASTDEDEDAPVTRREAHVDCGDLDCSKFVVIGDGLLAGFGDFTLSEEFQRDSVPAQLARQFECELEQSLIQAPGIGNACGFGTLPVQFPAMMQTTGVVGFPEAATPTDLSIHGFRISDTVNLRPSPPLIHQTDAKQTMANLVLGLSELMKGKKKKYPTQLESAVALSPTFALVSVGYQDVLEAATSCDAKLLPDPGDFRRDYATILGALTKAGAKVMVTTIPSPVDTAYFSTLATAADTLRVEIDVVGNGYNLASDDLISVPALMEMGFQMISNDIGGLPEHGVLHGSEAREIGEGVAALNTIVAELATEYEVELFDLAALICEVGKRGVSTGKRHLSAEFLGGFYLLNGYFPGPSGNAVIANSIIAKLNESFDASIPKIALAQVLRRCPAADSRRATGPLAKASDLVSAQEEIEDVVDVAKKAANPAKEMKPARSKSSKSTRRGGRLELPPGRKQTLPISKESSYFGDAIRATNCRDENDHMFGGGREMLFGGLAMVDSHISGEVSIEFSEVIDDISEFKVFHGRLVGDDGCLAAPCFFKLPALRNEVNDDSKIVSTGKLNLATGEVTDLDVAVRFGNTALLSLVRVNPLLPDIPIQFPGMYGSAWAKFEQRDDGLLDYTFYGTTFLPLGGSIDGDPVRFPLPFCSPTLEFASIPAPGTSLHPHLHVSTKDPEPADPAVVPEIPTNTIREYTIHTHNTSFGDKFTLHSSELAGDPTGRSQLLGRVQVQYGAPSGDSVPVAISCLNPGGMMAEPAPSPLADDFPGHLPPAPTGHNEFLRFSTRTYYLDALTCIDDPFDVSVGNVSRKSGRLLTDLLHRALIGQNLFYALLRVEPRTPKSSFFFRGPARFEKGKDGRSIFRFAGQVTVPYPEGFLFPSPDMASGVPVGANSILDPFYWVQAMEHDPAAETEMKGSATKLLASTNEVFSYKYDLHNKAGGRKPKFEYVNHSVDGTFKLESLNWVSFINSRGAGNGDGHHDCVTFAGFGTWSKDASGTLHLVCGQISEAEDNPYVSIQVDSGRISNVNTKPAEIEAVRP